MLIHLFLTASSTYVGSSFVGLKNVGNSCWFNALLFTYFMIPAVRMSILGLPGYGHFKNLQQQLQEQEQSQMSGQLQQQSADNVNNCRATHLSQEQIVQIRRMACSYTPALFAMVLM